MSSFIQEACASVLINSVLYSFCSFAKTTFANNHQPEGMCECVNLVFVVNSYYSFFHIFPSIIS